MAKDYKHSNRCETNKKEYHLSNGDSVLMTEREFMVANYVIQGSNFTEARLKAGYKDYTKDEEYLKQHANHKTDPMILAKNRNAASASQLFRDNPEISIYANDIREKHENALQLTTESMLKSVAAIVNFDPAELIDDDGNPRPLSEVPEKTRLALSSMNIDTYQPKEGPPILTYKYTWYNKIQAIALLTKIEELSKGRLKGKMIGNKTVSLRREKAVNG